MNFLIFPIHLFNVSILKKCLAQVDTSSKFKFILLEDPCYFGFREERMNFNKLKLLMHRASMKYYEDLLMKPKTRKLLGFDYDVVYVDFETIHSKGYASIRDCDKLAYFDVVDFFLENKLDKALKGVEVVVVDSPAFIDTRNDLELYHSKINKHKSFFHDSFYKWQKSKLGVLTDVASLDKLNRDKLGADVDIPPLYKNDSSTKWIKEADKYVERVFSEHGSGSVANGLKVPITHKTTISWVRAFCRERLKNFGKYEDAIDASRNFLFHSVISPMLNIGLITPQETLMIVVDYYHKHQKEIALANYEGFVRQLIGWREYQRYIYRYAYEKMTTSNHFNNRRTLAKSWYDGTTGIEPVDVAIKQAFSDGYIHHILRLMVIGNVMNLCGIAPASAYKWFMEFAIDSYDWVMVGNVYSMAFWADGGLTMRKPYISGDNYIMKMSNFKKGKWNEIWNAVFYHFVETHQDILKHTVYAGVIRAWNKMGTEAKAKINATARDFIGANSLVG